MQNIVITTAKLFCIKIEWDMAWSTAHFWQIQISSCMVSEIYNSWGWLKNECNYLLENYNWSTLVAFEKEMPGAKLVCIRIERIQPQVLPIFSKFIQGLVWWLKCRTVKNWWGRNVLSFLKSIIGDRLIVFENKIPRIKLFIKKVLWYSIDYLIFWERE